MPNDSMEGVAAMRGLDREDGILLLLGWAVALLATFA
jgi:hypothetical protein